MQTRAGLWAQPHCSIAPWGAHPSPPPPGGEIINQRACAPEETINRQSVFFSVALCSLLQMQISKVVFVTIFGENAFTVKTSNNNSGISPYFII